jgi:glycosyltransferase involved in cell wall biosynthesis
MSEADSIVVTDTGSDDGTVEKLRKRGVTVYRERIVPWRFDTARNISLNHVPKDVDICVCVDLDEIFEKGWRDCLEAVWTDGTTTGRYLYNWSHKPDGTPDVQFHYFKVHSRVGYEWRYPVHECLRYIGEPPERAVFVPGMVLHHYPDSAKSRGSYLPLLELAAREEPEDSRMAYYLGREYLYKGAWEQCIAELQRHLALKTSVWDEERCASMRWIAKAHFARGEYTEAYRWYYRAIAECPAMREPYIECAVMAQALAHWEAVFFMTEQALKIKSKSQTYVNAGYCWDHTPDDLAAIGCYWLGMYEKSLKHAKAALALCPGDARLAGNVALIEEQLK